MKPDAVEFIHDVAVVLSLETKTKTKNKLKKKQKAAPWTEFIDAGTHRFISWTASQQVSEVNVV